MSRLNAAWYARLVDAARPTSSRAENVKLTYASLIKNRSKIDWVSVVVNIFGLREALDAGLVEIQK